MWIQTRLNKIMFGLTLVRYQAVLGSLATSAHFQKSALEFFICGF